jgi:outer membrane protein OmpA-like peptidoglycan-associated protein
MKSILLLLPVFCLAQLSLHAQVTVVPASGTNTVVVQEAVPLNTVVVQRQLSTAPKVIVMQAPAASTNGAVIKTTKTTTTVDTPGQPLRVYNSERNVVLVESQNQTRELPYVTLPVLFARDTDKLLDSASLAALQEIAGVINAVAKNEPGARFDIEGHTSVEGTDAVNMALSADRAKRVYDELTTHYGVPAETLSAHGYGKMYPMFPTGTEAQRQLDRRVLVVRTN